jgi:hypothetical protein
MFSTQKDLNYERSQTSSRAAARVCPDALAMRRAILQTENNYFHFLSFKNTIHTFRSMVYEAPTDLTLSSG